MCHASHISQIGKACLPPATAVWTNMETPPPPGPNASRMTARPVAPQAASAGPALGRRPWRPGAEAEYTAFRAHLRRQQGWPAGSVGQEVVSSCRVKPSAVRPVSLSSL